MSSMNYLKALCNFHLQRTLYKVRSTARKTLIRDDWNEDWAIVDGAGYFDMQEKANGELVMVESNKLTVRYHTISPTTLHWLRIQLR